MLFGYLYVDFDYGGRYGLDKRNKTLGGDKNKGYDRHQSSMSSRVGVNSRTSSYLANNKNSSNGSRKTQFTKETSNGRRSGSRLINDSFEKPPIPNSGLEFPEDNIMKELDEEVSEKSALSDEDGEEDIPEEEASMEEDEAEIDEEEGEEDMLGEEGGESQIYPEEEEDGSDYHH